MDTSSKQAYNIFPNQTTISTTTRTTIFLLLLQLFCLFSHNLILETHYRSFCFYEYFYWLKVYWPYKLHFIDMLQTENSHTESEWEREREIGPERASESVRERAFDKVSHVSSKAPARYAGFSFIRCEMNATRYWEKPANLNKIGIKHVLW